jgi:hypothetical protein
MGWCFLTFFAGIAAGFASEYVICVMEEGDSQVGVRDFLGAIPSAMAKVLYSLATIAASAASAIAAFVLARWFSRRSLQKESQTAAARVRNAAEGP